MKDNKKPTIKQINNFNEQEENFSNNWTWYLLLAICFILLLGIAISWILVQREAVSNLTIALLPSLICCILCVILLGVFIYFDTKDFNLLKYHVPKKIFNIYIASIFLFAFSILFVIIYMFCYQYAQGLPSQIYFIIGIVISAILTLIAIGVYKYSRYKIDLSVYLRKHGKNQKEIDENQTKDIVTDKKASSGITDAVKE